MLSAVLVVGCSGDQGTPDGPPEEVLAAAQDALVSTSGVSLSLTTEELPDDVDGVLEATGVATRAPAFEGELTVSLNGLDVDVPVISVDGKVYARLPFTASFAEVNPADYGASDPAQLMASDTGIAAWLTEATEIESGDQVRQGDTVLSTYRGTLSGQVVDASIPSADETAEFPVALDDYGATKDIEAP